MTVMPQNSRKRDEDKVAILKVGGTTLFTPGNSFSSFPMGELSYPWRILGMQQIHGLKESSIPTSLTRLL
jgi:hypothetical protein